MKSAKKVCLKIIIFLLPLVIFFLPILLSGEHLDGGDVARLMHVDGRSLLYGPIIEDNYRYYKAESARLVKPSVLVVGASRALQIRSFFFNNDVAFYNAGFVTGNTADMQCFLEAQDPGSIDILIISLAQQHFNENIPFAPHPGYTDFSEPAEGSAVGIDFLLNHLLWEIKTGKPVYGTGLWNMNIIGRTAKTIYTGMLNDGSFYYGYIYQQADTGQDAMDRMAGILARIENATDRYIHGEHVNPDAVNHLTQFLQYCRNNNIHVIAYVPSASPTVNDAIRAKGSAYGYRREMLAFVPAIFEEYGHEFYDYTDAAFLGCTEDFYIDGDHASDVVFLRMFIDMIERGSRLGDYCNVEDLQAYDRARFSDLRIFDTWEQYNGLWLAGR